MKKLLLILLCLPIIGFGQFNFKTYVPDDNFETYLEINGMGDGIQLNDSINTLSIEMLMYLDVSNQNISDLTGIEDFTVLTSLNCSENNLTTLDVSNNIYLTELVCYGNQLTILDVSNNFTLTDLFCGSNQLTILDVTQNPNLLLLGCNYNPLISLDLRNGNNTSLSGLWCLGNSNLYCINVDDSVWSTANWTVANQNIDPQHYFSNNCSPSAIQEHTTNKELLKVTDLLGRETKQTNQPLFYIYDDGTVEKRIVIE